MAVLLVLVSMGGPLQELEDRIRVQGNGYAFFVVEPEGWRISLNSAPQIASFVMHPASTPWRQARMVVFGRFVRHEPDETLEAFAEADLEGYQKTCPFYEASETALEVKRGGPFLTKALHCPGLRHEMVAFTQGAGFFATFVLSAKTPDVLAEGLDPFREMLESFAWASQR